MTAQFVSALELATYFNGTTNLADLTPEWIAQANLLLQMISADVQAAAGVPIEAGSGTLVVGGTWSRDLDLPAGPIRSITAVTVNGLLLAVGTYTFNDRQLIRRAGSFEELGEYSNGQGAGHRSGEPWGGPAATVLVELAYGYVVVPDFVRSLVLRIAGRTFGNVGQVTQESLAIYSVSYGASANVNDGSHVTNTERKRLRNMLNRTGGTIYAGGR